MVRSLLLLSVLVLCVAVPASAGQVWDLISDFSHTNNPNGVWTYGCSYGVDASYAFIAMSESYELTYYGPVWANCWGWRIPGNDNLPAVWANPNAEDHDWIPANTAAGHPGWGIQDSPSYVVMRWTAPDAGNYQVSMTVYGGTTASFNSLDMHVLLNGAIVPDADQRCGRAYGVDGAYAATFSLAGGDTLDLAVGPDGACSSDGYLVGYSVEQVVPEPSAVLALMSGLAGFVGVAVRRRKV